MGLTILGPFLVKAQKSSLEFSWEIFFPMKTVYSPMQSIDWKDLRHFERHFEILFLGYNL